MAGREQILDPERVERVQRALAAIWPTLDGAIELPTHSWMSAEWVRGSFGEGLAGPTLAIGYRALARGDDGLADRCRELLLEAIDAGKALWMAPGLVQGFAGLGFLVEHLVAIGLVEDARAVTDPIAGRVREAIAPGGLSSDHFFGTAGMIVHGVERVLAAGPRDVLDDALAHVARIASREPAGITWIKVADTRWMDPAMAARYPDGHVDTTMSHGVGGTLAALAAAHAVGADTRELLAGGLAWLWSVQRDDERQWPSVIGEDGGGQGWCRGDLGVAVGACSAALALEDRDAVARASAALRLALARRDWNREAVTLCHGPAGAAHVAHRMFGITGEGAFADAARSACDDLLDGLARTPDLGPSLLTGRSGVALALLSLLEEIEPTWDRWLLPGVPQPA